MIKIFNYISKSLILITLMLYISGCSIDHGRFTVLSNKVFRLSELDLDKADHIKKDVVGEDIVYLLLFIPLNGKMNPTLDGALDDAMQKGDGDVMTDVAVEQNFFTIYLFTQAGWRVQGDVVKTRKN